MIVEKIEALLGKGKGLVGLEKFTEDIEWALRKQLDRGEEELGKLRLSNLGQCPRKIAYSIIGAEKEPLTPRARMTFLFGDIIEAVTVVLIKSAGINLHSQQKEVEFDGVTGHIDGIVEIDGENFLFECKSMSDYSFKDLKRNGLDNTWGYLTQANVYMEALGLDKAILVAVNKNTGHFTEVLLPKNKHIINEAKETIQLVRNFEKTRNLPPRKYDFVPEVYRRKETGRYVLPVQCSYCAYVKTCWEGRYEVEIKGGKPKLYRK